MNIDFAKNNPYMRMVINIMRTGSMLDHRISDILSDFGITHIQFNILRNIEAAEKEAISLNEVGEGLMFRTSDVSRLVDRLVKKGLLNRNQCSENRRKMDISLTKEGLEIIDQALPRIREALDNYFSDRVTESERDLVTEVLKRLNI